MKDDDDCKDCIATVSLFAPSCHFREPTLDSSDSTISTRYDEATQDIEWIKRRRSKGNLFQLKINSNPNA